MTDEQYMARCIELADEAGKRGEFPFGSLLVIDGEVVSEAGNDALMSKDVVRHAEILALTTAQKAYEPELLRRATLYSSVEPCPMCAFAIQELGIRRVVFGLRSPIMGGYSRWPVLQDTKLGQTFPNIFGAAPEIVPDILKDKVIEGWKRWNLEQWESFKQRCVFA